MAGSAADSVAFNRALAYTRPGGHAAEPVSSKDTSMLPAYDASWLVAAIDTVNSGAVGVKPVAEALATGLARRYHSITPAFQEAGWAPAWWPTQAAAQEADAAASLVSAAYAALTGGMPPPAGAVPDQTYESAAETSAHTPMPSTQGQAGATRLPRAGSSMADLAYDVEASMALSGTLNTGVAGTTGASQPSHSAPNDWRVAARMARAAARSVHFDELDVAESKGSVTQQLAAALAPAPHAAAAPANAACAASRLAVSADPDLTAHGAPPVVRSTMSAPMRGEAATAAAQVKLATTVARLAGSGKVPSKGAAAAALAAVAGPRARLKVRIDRLALYDLPAFSEEDWTAAALGVLHAEYASRLAAEALPALDAKVAALLPPRESLEVPSVASGQQPSTEAQLLLAQAAAAVRAVKERHEEHVYQGTLATAVYDRWESLKQLRQRQGYTSTKVRLAVRHVQQRSGADEASGRTAKPPRPDASKRQSAAQPDKLAADAVVNRVASLLSDLAEIVGVDLHEGVLPERAALILTPAAQATPGQPLDPFSITSSALFISEAKRVIAAGDGLLRRLRAVLSGQAAGTPDAGGIDGDGGDYVLTLVQDDTLVTPDLACPGPEAARRAAARRTKLYTRVFANGHPVGEYSQPVSVAVPGWVANIAHSVELALTRRPASLEIEVWMRGGDLTPAWRAALGAIPTLVGNGKAMGDLLLARVPIAVPGADAANSTPSEGLPVAAGRWQFAARNTMARSDETPQQSSARVAWVGLSPATRRTSGALLASVAWGPGILPDRPVQLVDTGAGRLRVEGVAVREEAAAGGSIPMQFEWAPMRGNAAGRGAAPVPLPAVAGVTIGAPLREGTADSAQAGSGSSQALAVRHQDSRALVLHGVAAGELTPAPVRNPNDPGDRTFLRHERGPAFREAGLMAAGAFVAPDIGAGAGMSVRSTLKLDTAELMPGMVLPGGRRCRLLRLRESNPAAFAQVWRNPVPMAEDEIAQNAVLRRVLMTGLGSSAAARLAEMAASEAAELGLGDAAASFARGEGHASVAALLQARTAMKAAQYMSSVSAKHGDGQRRTRTDTAGLGMGNIAGWAPPPELEAVVKDVDVPTLAGIDLSFITAAFAPKRALNPGAAKSSSQSKSRNAAPAGDDGAGVQFQLRVQLVRGRNLPKRSTARGTLAIGMSAGVDGSASIMSPQRQQSGFVSPQLSRSMTRSRTRFTPARGEDGQADYEAGAVENARPQPILAALTAYFQGAQATTKAVPGPAPAWNVVLDVPLALPGDRASPAALAALTSPVLVSLFDHVTIEQAASRRSRAASTTLRERRWLGAISLPFHELYASGGVAAELRLHVPTLLFGYELAGEALAPGAVATSLAPQRTDERDMESTAVQDMPGLMMAARAQFRSPHVLLSVTVEPALPPPPEQSSAVDDLFGASAWRVLSGQTNLMAGFGRGGHAVVRAPPASTGPGAQRKTRAGSASRSKADRSQRGSAPQRAERRPEPGPETVADSSGVGFTLEQLRRAWSWASRWQSTPCNDEPGRRHVLTVVEDNDGTPRLVTQYLNPIPPPPAATFESLPAGTASGRFARHSSSEDSTGSPVRGGGRSLFEPAMDGPLGEVLAPADMPRLATYEAVVRFVASMPFVTDVGAFGAAADVWTPPHIALDMAAGDSEEHAVLLASYFAWLDDPANGVVSANHGWHTYLAFGRQQPGGDVVWVARVKPGIGKALLIDPVTGRSYNASDSGCPLRAVDALADASNVWANAQRQVAPWRTSWAVNLPKEWAPLWGVARGVVGPIPPQVPLTVDVPYTLPHRAMVAELEDDIADRLMSDLSDWRRQHLSVRTDWRRDLALRLRELCDSLELSAELVGCDMPADALVGLPNAEDVSVARHAGYLGSALSRYRAYGFPLWAPFTDIPSLSRRLQSTRIAATEAADVEFALGVRVVPHANFVLGVWLYVVVLTPR